MKKIGIYPGSFNPWHAGHRDILLKALEVFDVVHVVVLVNPEKGTRIDARPAIKSITEDTKDIVSLPFYVRDFDISLRDAVERIETEDQYIPETRNGKYSIIRGLRNGNDLQYEMNNQYWNEDVGIAIPFVYFITDRNLAHVSSSAIRSVQKLGLKHPY
jgi:pantetheine-phosphate adenylyltransferase